MLITLDRFTKRCKDSRLTLHVRSGSTGGLGNQEPAIEPCAREHELDRYQLAYTAREIVDFNPFQPIGF